MPQMNTVLLPTVEASTEKQMVQSNKSDSNSSENKDFSLALAEASSPKRSVSTNEKAGSDLDKLDVISNEPVDDAQEESDDVSNVLAQINLAAQFAEDESVAADGGQLPLANAELIEPEFEVDQEDLGQAASQQYASDKVGLIKITLPDETDGISLSDDVPLEDVPLDDETNRFPNKNLIDQLTPTQLDSLVKQTGLDKDQLIELPPQMLQALLVEVDKFALQGFDQKSMPTELKSLIEQANKLISELDAKAPGVEKGREQIDLNLAINASVTDKPLAAEKVTSDPVLPISKARDPASVLGTSTEGKAILGDVNSDLAVKSALSPEQSLAQTGKTAQAAQANTVTNGVDLNSAKLSVTMAADADGIDAIGTQLSDPKPTNQGMNVATNIRTETPAQYQVSIKPNGEPAQHIQEMIQKFSPVMQQQLLTMVKQGVQHAEIRLDPPELGHMMVRIQVQGDQTQVQFQVMQHQTKDLVEQAIPRLRELLAEQGMQLSDSHVSQEGSNHQQGESEGNHGHGHSLGSDMDEISAEESVFASNSTTSYRSGIDYYA
ncbi:flagellar hook-length control protein FliK [Shewanella mesophila]|uniref:flagellar hook-length control protein FliK n=1 Tax=Shewanella mesophila TaxID=2864208 RepID=UPI001C65C16C|nr:flagellar hook-length control protein FliK [Shewanella mesophila]QYJ85044.1 flagellar hook-length control protein FliK [Shewanella mesophila]